MDRFSSVVEFRSAVETTNTTHKITMADRQLQFNATSIAFRSKPAFETVFLEALKFVAPKICVY